MRSTLFHTPLITLTALVLLTPAAVAKPVSWDSSFLFSGGGLENPLLRVAFNPQPEPPAAGVLSFQDPPVTGYPPDPVITHNEVATDTPFQLLVGLGTADTPLSLTSAAFSTPSTLVLTFGSLGGIATPAGGAALFDVEIDLTTESGGNPIDIVAFNPQPEPPAVGAGAAAYGAEFLFSSYSAVSAAFRLHDATGTPLTLTRVAEPTLPALLGLGLLALLSLRQRQLPGGI